MEIRKRMPVAGIVLIGTLRWMGMGFAAGDEGAVVPIAAISTESTASDMGAVINEQTLTDARGGTEVINDMTLSGVVAGNQAYNLSTGNNTVTDGAMAGASGIPTLIQNSGNNVLIQNATIVNVQLK